MQPHNLLETLGAAFGLLAALALSSIASAAYEAGRRVMRQRKQQQQKRG